MSKKLRANAVKIDDRKLKEFMRLKPTLEDAAAFFDCSKKSIERYLERTHKLTFTEFRERHMVHTRFELIREALTRAKTSDTILIFCLKNLCGWTNEPSTLVQVKTETHVNTEESKALVQGFRQAFVGYLNERKESP